MKYRIKITCRFGEHVAAITTAHGDHVQVVGRGRTAAQARAAIPSSFRHLPVDAVNDAAASLRSAATEEPNKAA